MIKHKIAIIVFFSFLALVVFSIVYSPDAFYTNVVETLTIWLYNVYPSVFTLYIIASCLVNFNIITKISMIAKPFIKFTSPKAYELFIISIFVGNPSSASMVMNELKYQTITRGDALKLLKVCSFFSPLFIISIITASYIDDIKYAFLIIVSTIITNLIIGLFIVTNNEAYEYEDFDKPIVFQVDKVFVAINQVIHLLLVISGIMVFSNILKFGVSTFIEFINFDHKIMFYLIANFEASTGAVDIFDAKIGLHYTLAFIAFILTFQGLSVNIQVVNVIKGHKIKFLPIFILRIFQGLLAACITFIFCNILI